VLAHCCSFTTSNADKTYLNFSLVDYIEIVSFVAYFIPTTTTTQFSILNSMTKTSYGPGGGETICHPPADGSSTVAKIAADLRPSADGSASLVAGGG